MEIDSSPSSSQQESQSEYFAAKAILKEKGDNYLIDWIGEDPETGKPWIPSWHQKGAATEDLIEAWNKKKKLKKRGIKLETSNSKSKSTKLKSKSTTIKSSPSPIKLIQKHSRIIESSPTIILSPSTEPATPTLIPIIKSKSTFTTIKKSVTFNSDSIEMVEQEQSDSIQVELDSSNPIIPDSQINLDPSPPSPPPPPPPAPAPPAPVNKSIPIMRTDAGPSNLLPTTKSKILKPVPVLDPSIFAQDSISIDSQQEDIITDSSPIKIVKKVFGGDKPMLDLGNNQESQLEQEVEMEVEKEAEEEVIEETILLPISSSPIEIEKTREGSSSLIQSLFDFSSKLFNKSVSPPNELSNKRSIDTIELEQNDPTDKRVKLNSPNKSTSSPNKNPNSIISAIKLSNFINSEDDTKLELIKFITSPTNYLELSETPLLIKKEWNFILREKLNGSLGLLILKPRLGEFKLASTNNTNIIIDKSIYNSTQLITLQSINSTLTTTNTTLQTQLSLLESISEQNLILQSKLSKSTFSLTSVTSDRDFFQLQYNLASNSANERALEARTAESKVEELKNSLDIGLKQRDLFTKSLKDTLKEKLRKVQGELVLMRELNRRTQGLREKASLWDDYLMRIELMEEEEVNQDTDSSSNSTEEELDDSENPNLFICLWRLNESIASINTIESSTSGAGVGGENSSSGFGGNQCGLSFNSKNELETHLIGNHCFNQLK